MLRSHQAKASDFSLIFDFANCEQLHRKQCNHFFVMLFSHSPSFGVNEP